MPKQKVANGPKQLILNRKVYLEPVRDYSALDIDDPDSATLLKRAEGNFNQIQAVFLVEFEENRTPSWVRLRYLFSRKMLVLCKKTPCVGIGRVVGSKVWPITFSDGRLLPFINCDPMLCKDRDLAQRRKDAQI